MKQLCYLKFEDSRKTNVKKKRWHEGEFSPNYPRELFHQKLNIFKFCISHYMTDIDPTTILLGGHSTECGVKHLKANQLVVDSL